MHRFDLSDAIKVARSHGVQVGPEVAKYVAALVSVEADSGDGLTQQVVDTIAYRTNGFMDVVELQVGMEQAFQQQRQLVAQEQQEQAVQLQVLQQGLLEADAAHYRSFKDYTRLHDAILQHVCLATPALAAAFSDEGAAQQVRAALASVFPAVCAAMFVTAGGEERLEQLQELARATLGICCLHQATGSSSHMMPAGLETACARGHKLLASLEEGAAGTSSQLATAADLLEALPGSASRGDALLELLHRWQLHAYQRLLLADLRSCLGAVQLLQQEEQRLVEELLLVIGSSEVVPRERVLPLFVSLGATRAAISDEVRLLVVHQRLADRLAELDQAAVPLLLKAAMGTGGAPQQAEAPAQTALGSSEVQQIIGGLPGGWTYASAAELGAGPALALAGLCPMSLAGRWAGSSTAGPIIPSLRQYEPGLGCIRSPDGKLYGCAAARCLHDFARDPAGALAAVCQQAACHPLLVHLLGMQQQLPQCDLHAILSATPQQLTLESGTQTPTHFLEQHLDQHYEWNAWVLRRRALALANLKDKRTHSTQTAESHFKRDGQTQVWVPKEAAQQTPVDQGSTMPRKLRYVGGLRGSPSRPLRVVTLDLALSQPRAASRC